MLARSSRSRSRTIETPTRKSLHTSSISSLVPESDNSSSRSLLPTLTPDTDDKPKPSSKNMITTMTSQSTSGTNIPVILTDVAEEADAERATARSSSLSELGDDDVSDLLPDTLPRGQFSSALDMEVDSEAETERLDKSPLKQNTIAGRDQATDQQNGLTGQPDSTSDEMNDTKGSHSISLESIETGGLAPLPKSEGKGTLGKRKRPQSGITTLSIAENDEPSPKRALTDDIQLDLIAAQLNADIDAAEYETDDGVTAEDAPSNEQETNGHVETDTAENEEDKAVNERKTRPGRKGRRKMGKPAFTAESEIAADVSDNPAIDTEPADEEAEEEDDQSHDEEQAKRKIAANALADIEKDFIFFRERHLSEQLEQVEYDLQLLRRPSCTHPEFLAQLKCVDERRDQKLLYEDRLLGFNLENLTARTVADRQQLHSQYFQEIRQIRDNAIKMCYQELWALQRDRRRFGSGDKTSLPLYTPKRSDQLLRQASYNMEVSLLSGIAKYVGFPAAPDMSALASDEIGHDLQLMGINVARVGNSARPQALTDRSIAEEQFFEQTPWANPQHPAHMIATIHNFHTQTAPVQFLTPVLQNRNVDIAAINGSASTIEMASNPPSSIAGPSHHQVQSPLLVSQSSKAVLKDMERIQTTHASTAASRDNQIEQKTAQPDRDADLVNIAQYHQYHNIASRRSLLNSTSPPSTNRSLGAEILGPTPQRAVIAASIGSSPGRFGQ